MPAASSTSTRALEIACSTDLTHEQALHALAACALDGVQAFAVTQRFRELEVQGCLCTMSEGGVPWCPRYLLPDYARLLAEGSDFLRLAPACSLEDALMSLLVAYRHVPSVTHYPVYLGAVDELLGPFIADEAQARDELRRFLMLISRTIPDSYCHMNLGPADSFVGRAIIGLEQELAEAIPAITLLYDPKQTPDALAEACVSCALACVKPSFANWRAYDEVWRQGLGLRWGIASCYNALPVGGGAFTLSRVVLARLAERAKDRRQLIEDLLPEAVSELCGYMEAKIAWLVEKSQFFRSSFLVREGLVSPDRFVGMVGVAGMNECVNQLMRKEGREGRYGTSPEASHMAHEIMKALASCVAAHTSTYCACTAHRFVLHAQVGIAEDKDVSPGVRVAIGSEPPLFEHLAHCAEFHPYFPAGVGDIFPFESTAAKNPAAIVDVIKGAFTQGVRHLSTYASDSDVIRVTGYLVKKSDLARLARGEAVAQANATWGLGMARSGRILERRVRSLDGLSCDKKAAGGGVRTRQLDREGWRTFCGPDTMRITSIMHRTHNLGGTDHAKPSSVCEHHRRSCRKPEPCRLCRQFR